MHQNSFFWHLSPREPLCSRMFTKGVSKEDETLGSLHPALPGCFYTYFSSNEFLQRNGGFLGSSGSRSPVRFLWPGWKMGDAEPGGFRALAPQALLPKPPLPLWSSALEKRQGGLMGRGGQPMVVKSRTMCPAWMDEWMDGRTDGHHVQGRSCVLYLPSTGVLFFSVSPYNAWAGLCVSYGDELIWRSLW